MFLSKCAVFHSKKSRFIKNQEASELLSGLGLKTPLSKIPILEDVLSHRYKINEVVNKDKFLARDKCMPEVHLRQPGFTYSACRISNKNKERIQKFKETEDSR